MGVLTVALRRADSNNAFADVYMQSMTPLIKMAAESDETLDKALDKRLPEEVDTVPSTLVAGKIVSVKGVLYVGGPTGAPVKVTYSHPTSSGNKHLPAGGTKGQYLTNADGEGGGVWADLPAASTTKAGIVQLSDGVTVADATKAATANAVKKAYDKANHSHPYVPTSQVGAKGGVAPLDENGIISSTYLPSYVDDVIDGTISDDLSTFTDTASKAVTPEAGKIYNDITKNKSYRWSGSAYVSLNDGIALGETEKTAYRGDRGKVAYEHSQSAHARTDATKTEKSNTNGNVKINGSDVTVYIHPTTAGNKHLPAAGTVGQYLKNTAAGTGAWESADTEPTTDSVKLITSGAVAQVKTDLMAEIGKKANSGHTHTKAEVGLGNVDNKSSETIRSEITKKNVTDALGYTPVKTVPGMTGATASKAGAAGTVPAPAAGDNAKFLAGNGTWATPKDTVYTHPVSGVTAASYGPSANATPTYGATFNVPNVTVDENGHITAAATRTVKIPNAPTTITGNAGSATKLATPRTIKFTGDVTGSFAFDGSTDVSTALSAAVSAIKEQNGHVPTYMWIGTSAQYKALTKKYTEAVDDTLYFVTDEEGTDSFMSGVKLNDKLLTLSSGVASINALTGITLDGVTVTTSNGIAALTTPKLTYNGNAISKTNDTFAIVDNIQSIKMNGKVVSPDSSHAVNLSAITSIELGNTRMSVTNGAAKLANMGRIFYGTGDPSNSTGADGDIYIKYS